MVMKNVKEILDSQSPSEYSGNAIQITTITVSG